MGWLNLNNWLEAHWDEKLKDVLSLVDTYAETRHTCGCKEYNVKTLEAYEAVRQALKGR